MRILVDARLLRGGGIGRYVREVSARWLADPDMERMRFLGRAEELEPWLGEVDGRGVGVTIPFPHSSYSLGAQLSWIRRADELRGDAEVAFFPHYDVPVFRHPTPSVVVVHDVTHFRFRKGFPLWKRAAGRILLEGAVRRAGRVVTVSERSRRDLEAWSPGLEGRIEVVYPGVSDCFRPLGPVERAAARRRWSDLAPFLLVVGPVKPHKNLELAVRVLGELIGKHPTLRLVRVGPIKPGIQGLRAVARNLHLEDRVTEIGLLDDRSLREIYNVASALLFPSRYEGFGLPPVEARACGTEVVASDVGALREVLDGSIRLLDPDRPHEWVRAVDEILRDSEHGDTSDRRPATEIPFRPTWNTCARRLLNLMKPLLP